MCVCGGGGSVALAVPGGLRDILLNCLYKSNVISNNSGRSILFHLGVAVWVCGDSALCRFHLGWRILSPGKRESTGLGPEETAAGQISLDCN